MTEIQSLVPTNPLASVATMLATKGLALVAGVLVTHGWATGSESEMIIGSAPLLVSLAWSGWVEYGRPIFFAQLEVLKAKSLAQAAALAQNNLPKITVKQIAAQSPTMDTAAVTKAIATLPPAIKANVAT